MVICGCKISIYGNRYCEGALKRRRKMWGWWKIEQVGKKSCRPVYGANMLVLVAR